MIIIIYSDTRYNNYNGLHYSVCVRVCVDVCSHVKAFMGMFLFTDKI